MNNKASKNPVLCADDSVSCPVHVSSCVDDQLLVKTGGCHLQRFGFHQSAIAIGPYQ